MGIIQRVQKPETTTRRKDAFRKEAETLAVRR